MNKKIIAILGAMALLATLGAGCSVGNQNANTNTSANTNANTNQELIGGQKDAHGCLIAAGYSWCESKQKCLRTWEEQCYEAEEAALAQIFSSEHEQPLAETHVSIFALQNNFASGTISFGPAPEGGGAFLARLADGAWAVDYEGNGSVDCVKIKALGYPEEVLVGFCD